MDEKGRRDEDESSLSENSRKDEAEDEQDPGLEEEEDERSAVESEEEEEEEEATASETEKESLRDRKAFQGPTSQQEQEQEHENEAQEESITKRIPADFTKSRTTSNSCNSGTAAENEPTTAATRTTASAQVTINDIVDSIQPLPAPSPAPAPTLPGAMAVGGVAPPPPDLIANQRFARPGFFARDEENQHQATQNSTDAQNDITAAEDSSHGQQDYLVEATLVASDRSMRPELARRTTTVGIIVEALPVRRLWSNRFILIGIAAVMLLIFLLGLGLGAWKQDEATDTHVPTSRPSMAPSMSPTENPKPTLQQIRDRGVLRCAHDPFIKSFFQLLANNSGEESHAVIADSGGSTGNLDVGLCEAIAAAVNGIETPVELYNHTEKELLANGTVDIILKAFPNMASDVFEADIGEGLSYSVPFLSIGVGFSGIPEYVHCAEDDIKTFFNCSGIRICVERTSAFYDQLMNRIPHRQIVPLEHREDLKEKFSNGTCNVLATEAFPLLGMVMQTAGYHGPFATGTIEFTRELHAVATLDDDQEWTDFVRSVLLSLLAAEKEGITQTTAERMGETRLFGKDHARMFIDAVQTVGNFAELYDREVGLYERPASNTINNGTTGLLYSLPFGLISRNGPKPREGGTLQRILERKKLNCGVRGERPGFAAYDESRATWSGLDVDYCRALASSLFDGIAEAVEFEVMNNSATAFEFLSNGSIDVYAGAVWTLQHDIREPTTKQGFSFSKPYFYGPTAVEDGTNASALFNAFSLFDPNLALATREDDPQWSSFVFWVANSFVFAEENQIAQRLSGLMPVSNVFSMKFSRMLRNAVHAVGNYAPSTMYLLASLNEMHVWHNDSLIV
ncbi:extracellular solute-binding protein [Seminavis robusta]|uniref:Extracellular solute-binding protein n=1 Tax=Seminavis robusta TaxID=568900 RepID=A0A9N8H8R1_9STRA|nr:extracellular solute-binding protein [Seminavis robusta]|eukprot:Sro97_g050220.1 extracellular solute-binding protein (853) ;mRNA; r:118569-121499